MSTHRFPTSTPRLNRATPLSVGLTRAVLFDRAQSVHEVVRDTLYEPSGEPVSGRYGSERAFAAANNDAIDLGVISFGERFTIAFLGHSAQAGGAGKILGVRTAGAAGGEVTVRNGGENILISDGSSFDYVSAGGGGIQGDTPALIVYTRSSDTFAAYRDGLLNSEKTGTGVTNTMSMSHGLLIGGRNNNGSLEHADATLAMVAIWNDRALTASEVAAFAADPFVLFRCVAPVWRHLRGPAAGWRVYGGVGALRDIDLDMPIATCDESATSVSLDTSLRPTAGQRATYLVRHADHAGRTERGVTHVSVQNDDDMQRRVPFAAAWPAAPGWSPRRESGSWSITAVWGARLARLDVRTVQLVEQIEGDVPQVIASSAAPTRDTALTWTRTPPGQPARYRVRSLTGDDGAIDGPWSRWLTIEADGDATVAAL
ncbi:MAG: hypothetical protein GC159_14380 [Phycisphaera sp.]|nr:hypothetical protein [Phycisphaera sp.]